MFLCEISKYKSINIISSWIQINFLLSLFIYYIFIRNYNYLNTSENQNTEFFKCDLFWRIAIYHNSELFLVHLKTDKSHTFIMYLVIFCVSLSLRELSELRGVRWLKSIFMKNLEWNPWNLKEPTRSSKTKVTLICR